MKPFRYVRKRGSEKICICQPRSLFHQEKPFRGVLLTIHSSFRDRKLRYDTVFLLEPTVNEGEYLWVNSDLLQ